MRNAIDLGWENAHKLIGVGKTYKKYMVSYWPQKTGFIIAIIKVI